MSRRATTAEKARYDFLHEIGICVATGIHGDIQVAHIRGPDALFCKTESGMARKPHWVWTLPLRRDEHDRQHRCGEAKYWTWPRYPWRDIARGPMAAALVLEGFRAMDDVEGARTWILARIANANVDTEVIVPREPPARITSDCERGRYRQMIRRATEGGEQNQQ